MTHVTEVRLTLAAIIYAIELDLKALITKHIVPYNETLNFIGSDQLIEGVILRFKRDNPDVDPLQNIDDVVEYLDFGDFFRIILSNKNFFDSWIIDEVKSSLTNLQDLASVRNRVMHTRPLMSGDFTLAYSFASEKAKRSDNIWTSVRSTLQKIEEDPSYVLTMSLPIIKRFEYEAHHNLPIPDFDETGFIGRKQDVKDVLKLVLGNNRVITVLGDGGVGKTALALKVAYDILDLKDKNPFDLIIWVSAKTTMLTSAGIEEIKNNLIDFGGLMQGISEAVDSKSPDKNLETILEYLEVFDTLLILDNLETILDEKIRQFIRSASQNSKILITSRIGLGELEFRRPLLGMSENESISLIRQLANLKKSTVLNKLSNASLIEIAEKLHYNPLALKWFVNSVETGISPSEVLSNKDNLLNFCLSNVYDKLSEDALTIVNTILAARKNLNDAELVFITELGSLQLRRAINELFSTTFISREVLHFGESQEVAYTIPEFAKEYLLRNHPINGDFIKDISDRLKKLNKSAANITRISDYNEFGINAITIRNTNEKVVARILNDALRLSKIDNVEEALKKVKEATSILPNYVEVYRVSAFIKATFKDFLGAEEDYKLGLEIEPNNPRLLFFYGSFLLYNLADYDKAIICAEKVFSLRPESEYPALLLARILSTKGEYKRAYDILSTLVKKENTTKSNLRIIITDLIRLHTYWGKAILEKDGDYQLAIQKFKKSLEYYERSVLVRNYDERMTKVFCNSLKTYIKSVPKTHNEENIEHLKSIILRYDDQISLNNSKEYLNSIFTAVYDIKIDSSERIRYYGTIKNVFRDKQFAFIIWNTSDEIYVNKRNFIDVKEFDKLKPGMIVSFEVGKNNHGDCAINTSIQQFN